jgi:hypothetical protein
MRNMRFVWAISLILSLGSCAQTRTESMLPHCNAGRCEVAVTVVNDRPVVTPDPLEVKGGPQHIFWKLPPTYVFDPTQGDGVYLKSGNDGEFSEMFATDDDGANPSPAHRPAKNFHWRDRNSRPNVKYYYQIQFRKAGTTVPLFLDPIIVNSG